MRKLASIFGSLITAVRRTRVRERLMYTTSEALKRVYCVIIISVFSWKVFLVRKISNAYTKKRHVSLYCQVKLNLNVKSLPTKSLFVVKKKIYISGYYRRSFCDD